MVWEKFTNTATISRIYFFFSTPLFNPKLSRLLTTLFIYMAHEMGMWARITRIVGITTRYGLDGLGIESWRGLNFSHPSSPALGPTQTLVTTHPHLAVRLKKE